MNDLVNFTYEGRKVRTFIKNGDPQWVAKDVAEVLGYPETSNPARLFAHVPEEWKGRYPIPTLICEVNPIHTSSKARKSQDMLCLSEQGLYFFLGRSDKEAALPFQKWIAGEVIPSIRKTGSYALPGIDALG
jgi:prophage antirepressor-like protein